MDTIRRGEGDLRGQVLDWLKNLNKRPHMSNTFLSSIRELKNYQHELKLELDLDRDSKKTRLKHKIEGEVRLLTI